MRSPKQLLYFDPNFATVHNYTLYTTKRFWTLGNFSRFVRPGAQRHNLTGVPAGNATIQGRSATLTTPAQSITTFLVSQNG